MTMLMRYPEVASLHYDAEEGLIRFTFLCRQVEAEELRELEGTIRESLDAFFLLEDLPPGIFALKADSIEDITVLELERDVETLTLREISLLIALVSDRLEGRLLTEMAGPWYEGEDPWQQEEFMESLLDDLRRSKGRQRWIAYREEGRVFVFRQ